MAPSPGRDPDPALRRLLEEAIRAAGADDPATLPHRVHERLAGRLDGSIDVEAYVRMILEDRAKP